MMNSGGGGSIFDDFMGISMSDSLIAEGNRLGLKARALTSFAKKNASLNHKSETKNIYLTPRALSHSDKF